MSSEHGDDDDDDMDSTDTTPLTAAHRETESNGLRREPADVRRVSSPSSAAEAENGAPASLSPLLPDNAWGRPAAAAAGPLPRLSLWLPLACLLLAACALAPWLLQQEEQTAVASASFSAFSHGTEPDAASRSVVAADSPASSASSASSAALLASPSAVSRFASFLSELQQPSSSCSQSSRLLLFPCLSAAVELEHGSELYAGQSLAFLYSALRAALTAAASRRTLMLDRNGCDALLAAQSASSSNGTRPESSHALLCCSWDEYFAPLASCPGPESSARHSALVGSAFSAEPVMLYDARQQCLGQEEQWAALRSQWPAASRLSLVRTVASQLLRPAPAFASHLSALLRLLPPASSSPLLLHVPTGPHIEATPGKRRRSAERQARTQAVSSYLSVLRHHAASAPTSSLLLLAETEEVVQEVRAALPHLTVTPLLSVLAQYWEGQEQRAEAEAEARQHAVAVSAALLAAAVARDWVGEWSSVLAQLAAAASSRAGGLRVWDVNGELWTPSCWSVAPHLFTAHLAPPAAYNLPAVAALLSSSPARVQSPVAPRTQLVIVLGLSLPGSGVEELQAWLLSSAAFGLQPHDALAAAYSALFSAVNCSVAEYRERRVQLVSVLRSLQPSQRLLLRFTAADPTQERAVSLYHQPSLLASVINELALPISLQVLVLATRPRALLLKNLRASGLQAEDGLLAEGKVVRDLLSAQEAECKAMDVSLFRTVEYERLFRSDTQQEASRLSRWLGLTAEADVQAAAAALGQLVASQRPPLLSDGEDAEAEDEREPEAAAVRFLLDLAGSMQLFNPQHPSRSASAYDYSSTASSAVRALQQHTERGGAAMADRTLPEHIAALQADRSRCSSGRLLVFDGMRRWGPNSSTAASQVLDVAASLTLALATGRQLVVPPVPGSVTDFLLPLSGCDWEALGLQLEQQGAGWALTGADSVGADASSEVRVVLSHGQVLDAAYLQAWNAESPQRFLSLHDFIGCLLRLVLRPGPRLAAALGEEEQRQAVDASVSVPAVVNEPLSFYLTQLQSVLDSVAASRIRVRLSSSCCAFQHVAPASFIPQLPLSLTSAPSLGAAMVAAIATELQQRYGAALELQTVQRPDRQSVEHELRELLLQSRAAGLVLGSCGTAEGLIVAALVPVAAWHDLFSYQFVPSLLAYNSRQLLSTPPAAASASSSVSSSSLLLSPTAVQPVVRKAAISRRLRFLYFAGLEGTGHHAMHHLLSSLRLYSEQTGIRLERMAVEEKLSLSVWEVASASSLQQWQEAGSRLTQLVRGWQARYAEDGSDDMLVVINTLHTGSGFMQSWPNSVAEDRAGLHPSLTALAGLFESLQADLRVVSLSRAAGSLQSSTVLHRGFGSWLVGRLNAFYFQSRVLRVSMAALDADLEALDPAFVLDLALDRLQREPLLVMQAMGRHVGLVLQGEELQQAGLRFRELLGSRPDDAWLSEMTRDEAQLTQDMLAIASYLPHSGPFRFSAGPAGGGEERPSRRCRSRAMRLRQQPSPVTVLSLQGGGADYLRLLVEDSTAVMSSRHRFDSSLRPSTAAHLPHFAAANLTAYTLLETSLDEAAAGDFAFSSSSSSSSISPSAVLVLHRNPLDVALSAAFSLAQQDSLMQEEEMRNFHQTKNFAKWEAQARPLLRRLISRTLRTAATAYLQWAAHWRLSERRPGDGVVLLQLEELIAASSSAASLQSQLLSVLGLDGDAAALHCLASVSSSLSLSPRLLSPPASAAVRRVNGLPVLNDSLAAIQSELLRAASIPHSSAFAPFALQSVLDGRAFAVFRRRVDATAAAIMGPAWAEYCGEVEQMLADSESGG